MDEKSNSIRSRFYFLAAVILMIALIIGGVLLTRRAAFAAPQQPITFSHQLHDEKGVGCLFCHPSAMRADIAGIPSVEKCVGCHKTIATERDEVQAVLGYWERGEAIPWQAVVRIGDYVFFSHQPHLSEGIACETCHGNVNEMTVARPVLEMDMGWCLECHLDQPPEKVAQLTDCLTCHK